jgi:putative SOS response-associated peptidase YedK
MCGRYATTRTPDALADEFGAQIADSAGIVELEPDYNVAPTKPAPIVIERPATDDRSGGREVLAAQWGLVPSWAKDPKIGSRMINARSETVAEKPSFAKAFAKRRAIVPADGFYEWYQAREPDGSLARSATPGATHRGGEKTKQPFYITPKGGSVLAMAGLYEFWKASPDAGVPRAATLASRSGEWLITFTILTTSAADDLGHLHDRAPMMLVGDEIDAWLDPAPMSAADRLGLLVPAVPGRLDAWPVSTAVNNHRNNGPELIRPIPAE